jgi:hypothetical protein
VVKLFQDQFRKDFSLFLKLRHEELVFGGQMVLTFLGRKNEDVYSGDLNHLFGLLSESLQYLVVKVHTSNINSTQQSNIHSACFLWK